MNIQELIANLTALEQEVSTLKHNNNALQEQVSAIDHRINNLAVCDGPPTKQQKTDPKLQVQHLLNPAPPSDEPIDWLTKGIQAVDDAKYLQQSTKKATASLWKRALSGSDEVRYDPDVNQLWKHLQTFLQSIPKDSTRNTYFGQIETVFKAMGMEYDHDFKIAHGKLSNKVKADSEYQQLTPTQLEQYKCADGTYLTNEKLRAFCVNLPATVSDFHSMQLAFVAYHGNRGQDWTAGYGEANKSENGYYDPETATMHVSGKIDAIKENNEIVDHKTRIFKVHPEVEKAIARFHAGKSHVWLMPQETDETKCCQTLCKNLQRHIFKGLKNNLRPYGFPSSINPTKLRHLYETHIRYVDPMPKEELEATMNVIGHSDATSVKRYSEMFRAMHEPESQSQSK